MSQATIARSSTQPIYIPVRITHPITGDVDLSGATVKIAVVAVDPALTDYAAATVESGTWTGPDGDTYYIIKFDVVALTLPKGTLNVWAEVDISGDTFRIRSGPLVVY